MSTPAANPIFREEAEQHHRRKKDLGKLLYLRPTWSNHAYSLLLTALFSVFVFCFGFSINTVAVAPVILQSAGRIGIFSPTNAIVRRVLVHAGQRVEKGDPLVLFDTSTLQIEWDLATRDIASSTATFLTEPGDLASRRDLAEQYSRLHDLRQRIEQHTIRAASTGIVGDVRVHAGLKILHGDEVITMVRPSPSMHVIAIVPALHRPSLRMGQELRIHFDGLRHADTSVTVTTVGDEIVGPNEVRRYLGPAIADALDLAGPVVLVQGELADPYLHREGEAIALSDGMVARGKVLLRQEKIIFVLFPRLRELMMELKQ